jgi:YVTN family beta-propeller protein
VSVIDAATNTVVATIPVGNTPFGVGVSPDGTKVYVVNERSADVSVINMVTTTIPVGGSPVAFGVFIQPARPAPKFAGTPRELHPRGNSYACTPYLAFQSSACGDVVKSLNANGAYSDYVWR